jgi:NTP pyrophosphatase (non-canonical NTP hydrolase)
MSGASEDRLELLREKLRQFVAERDWGRFHDPKNLAMALASEAGELLAELRWISNSNADEVVRSPESRTRIENEVGDVAISLLLFCDRAGIDWVTAAEQKLEINAANYPAALSRGRAGRPAPAPSAKPFSRVIAVDWSGVAAGGHDTIWLAEVQDGELTVLENGRSRQELTDRLIEIAAVDQNIIVGLDFAFAFPEWFARENRAENVSELWRIVANEGEAWLRNCSAPFWGRPGTTKPSLPNHFRATETYVGQRAGGHAKSVFQIGGAGAVGTGSIRGMPQLLRLREAGFSIWPFDAVGRPLVVEIYPRLLTGSVVKSDAVARASYLAEKFPMLASELRERAASTEDAFDAAVSALVMARHSAELASLSNETGEVASLEGEIWAPMNVTAG